MFAYYKLHPILIGGTAQEQQRFQDARNRMILGMLSQERLGEHSVLTRGGPIRLHDLYQSIAEEIPDTHLRNYLQSWIESPIQFKKPNGEFYKYSDIEQLEDRIPILRQLTRDNVISLNQLLGTFITAEYDRERFIYFLNNYYRSTARQYNITDFPDYFFNLLYVKATNPLKRNGLGLSPQMIVHGRVPDNSIWKEFVRNLDGNTNEKDNFKIIAMVFEFNGEGDTLYNLLSEPLNDDSDAGEQEIANAFNNFHANKDDKILKFNRLFKNLNTRGVFQELIQFPVMTEDLYDQM